MDNDSPQDEFADSTDTCVQRARAGDSEAFSLLVDRHHRQVIRYVSGLVHDHQMADDIAQDTFLAAYQSLSHFNNQSEFSTWLLGIARNKAMSALRKIVAQRQRDAKATAHLIATWRVDYLERTDEEKRVTQIDALRECLAKLKPGAPGIA